MNLHKLVGSYSVTKPGRFRIDSVDPGDTAGLDETKKSARALLSKGVEQLAELQSMLYAQSRHGVLIVLQAIDAAGKDSTIRHVMSGVDPQGVRVTSFRAPSTKELEHDFLWRCVKQLPPRGHIGIFNRSYYEETLVARVHPEILKKQNLPGKVGTKAFWNDRFEDINAFERYLSRNGFLILKFFLHLSKDEQKRRFLSRLEEPHKHWKFDHGDIHDRSHWDDYQAAYEDMVRRTSTPWAPWHVVPADNKWFTRLVVVATIVEEMRKLKLSWPEVSKEDRARLAQAREDLLNEGRAKGKR